MSAASSSEASLVDVEDEDEDEDENASGGRETSASCEGDATQVRGGICVGLGVRARGARRAPKDAG